MQKGKSERQKRMDDVAEMQKSVINLAKFLGGMMVIVLLATATVIVVIVARAIRNGNELAEERSAFQTEHMGKIIQIQWYGSYCTALDDKSQIWIRRVGAQSWKLSRMGSQPAKISK